jgi:hypothetical protein
LGAARLGLVARRTAIGGKGSRAAGNKSERNRAADKILHSKKLP